MMTRRYLWGAFLHLFRCDPRECFEAERGLVCSRCLKVYG